MYRFLTKEVDFLEMIEEVFWLVSVAVHLLLTTAFAAGVNKAVSYKMTEIMLMARRFLLIYTI